MHFCRRVFSGLFLLTLLIGSIFWEMEGSAVQAATANVAVTASVLAKPVDFQSAISSDAVGNLEQGTVVTNTVTYGSHLLYGDQIKVEAQWYPGYPDGSSPSDIFEYVPGSATLGFGNTVPIVDSVNQKISWTIPNLPANTVDQNVTFQLKTNNSYTGNNLVNLSVAARVISRTVTTSDQSVASYYKYHGSPVVISASSEPAASSNPSPSPSPVTASPVVAVSPKTTAKLGNAGKASVANVVVKKASVPTITLLSLVDSSVKLAVQTSEASTINVSYGSTPNVQNDLPSDATLASLHTVVLNNLEPNTDHYVQVDATNASGEVTHSDTYVYKTAITSQQPAVQLPSVTFLTSNVTLFSTALTNSVNSVQSNSQVAKTPVIVLPKNTLYSFHFSSSKMQSIKKVLVIVRDAQVLGASTEHAQSTANILSTQLILGDSGNYEGNLKSPSKPGNYDIVAQLFDTDGNIVENKIADLHVSFPFRVIANDTQKPIEKAQVLLSYWSDKTNSYVLLPPQLFSAANPDYSDVEGNLADLALPQGKYQAKVSSTRYKTVTVDFLIGSEEGQDYPKIILERESFNILTMLQYFTEVFRDFADKRVTHLQTVAQSTRFFELNILIVSATLVFLTFLSFSTRIRIPLDKLPRYMLHRTRILLVNKDVTELVKGIVIDKLSGNPVVGADVYFVDERLKQVVAHKKTDQLGKFDFVKALSTLEAIEVMAEGYEPLALDADSYVCEDSHEHVLELEKSTQQKQILEQGLFVFEKILGLGFEFLLLQTMVFEVAFGFVLGWPKTLPFFAISILNMCLWLLHLTHRRTEHIVG